MTGLGGWMREEKELKNNCACHESLRVDVGQLALLAAGYLIISASHNHIFISISISIVSHPEEQGSIDALINHH